jgi:hypothetical protein
VRVRVCGWVDVLLLGLDRGWGWVGVVVVVVELEWDKKSKESKGPIPPPPPRSFVAFRTKQYISPKQIRAMAAELDLPTQARKDSQGICFLGKLRYASVRLLDRSCNLSNTHTHTHTQLPLP